LFPWSVHPFGRLAVKLMQQYRRVGDFQTAAMLSCVFNFPAAAGGILSEAAAAVAAVLPDSGDALHFPPPVPHSKSMPAMAHVSSLPRFPPLTDCSSSQLGGAGSGHHALVHAGAFGGAPPLPHASSMPQRHGSGQGHHHTADDSGLRGSGAGGAGFQPASSQNFTSTVLATPKRGLKGKTLPAPAPRESSSRVTSQSLFPYGAGGAGGGHGGAGGAVSPPDSPTSSPASGTRSLVPAPRQQQRGGLSKGGLGRNYSEGSV
jgi:hypothetical protein